MYYCGMAWSFVFGNVFTVTQDAIMFGLNFDQIVAFVSALIAGVSVGWARVSNMRSRSAKETAIRANEQSLSNQSGVNENYAALVEMQTRVGEMAVSIAQLQAKLNGKDEVIKDLQKRVEKVDLLESMVKVLQAENDEYKVKLVELQAQLDKANQIIERRGLL